MTCLMSLPRWPDLPLWLFLFLASLCRFFLFISKLHALYPKHGYSWTFLLNILLAPHSQWIPDWSQSPKPETCALLTLLSPHLPDPQRNQIWSRICILTVLKPTYSEQCVLLGYHHLWPKLLSLASLSLLPILFRSPFSRLHSERCFWKTIPSCHFALNSHLLLWYPVPNLIGVL